MIISSYLFTQTEKKTLRDCLLRLESDGRRLRVCFRYLITDGQDNKADEQKRQSLWIDFCTRRHDIYGDVLKDETEGQVIAA